MTRHHRPVTFSGMVRAVYRPSLLFALLAAVVALTWNTWNLQVLRRTPGAAHLLRAGTTIATADDPSYLRPVEDLLSFSPETAGTQGPQLRTPGYGLWYLIARLVLPPAAAFTALKLFQCLLFGASVGLVHHVLLRCGLPVKLVHGAAAAMAVLPMFTGFVFHTLTEGVTPALCIGVWAAAMRYAQQGQRGWLMAGTMLWSLLVLTRPVLVWAGLPLLFAAWTSGTATLRTKRLLLVLTMGLLPTGLWWVRNAVAAGGPISLHPVYSVNTPGLFRPTHKAFWDLAKSWGARGDRFHSAMVPAYEQALLGRIDTSAAEAYLATAPAGHLSSAEQQRIRDLFLQWAVFTRDRLRPAIHSPVGTLMELQPEEERIIAGVEEVTKDYRSAHAFHVHMVVPLEVLRVMVAHSNLNLYLFQHTYRGHWWMEALRWCCAVLHLLLFASLPFLVLLRGIPPPARAAALGALLYLGYLAYVQRGVEERYTLPVLHLAMALFPFLVHALLRHARRAAEN
jgi:hypothetical protein